MYRFVMTRARVDFGGDNFADVDLNDSGASKWLVSAKNLTDLTLAIKNFVSERRGQIVEVSNDVVQFDTKEMTIWGKVEFGLGQKLDQDKCSELEILLS